MNSIKRIISSLTMLTICLVSTIGVPVKNTLLNNQVNNIEKSSKSFCLYDGKVLLQNNLSQDNVKIADHYSHSSHESHSSHRSHYSSRY